MASTTSGKEGALLVQFIGQIITLHVLRMHRPDVPLPFRMWLYPILGAVAERLGVSVAHVRNAVTAGEPLGVIGSAPPCSPCGRSCGKMN